MDELIIRKQEFKPLLEREEIEAVIKSKITPSNEEVKQIIASKLNKQQELVVVKGIYGKFGTSESAIVACVYSNAKALEKFEPKSKEKKEKEKTKETAEKPAEKPAGKKE